MGQRHAHAVRSWRARWEEITLMPVFALEIRKLPHATNAVESLNRSLRKVLETRGHLPGVKAASNMPYLAIRNIERGWMAPATGRRTALNQVDILCGHP